MSTVKVIRTKNNLKILKTTKVKGLNKGLVISDPSYNGDVPFRYETPKSFRNFHAGIRITEVEQTAEIRGTEITIKNLNAKIGLFKTKKAYNIFECELFDPSEFTGELYEIGLDTAMLYIGNRADFNQFVGGIRTGTDGMIGNVIEFRNTKNNTLAGVLVDISISADMITQKELFDEIVSRFELESK